MFNYSYTNDVNFRAPVNTFYEHINGGGHYYTLLSGEEQDYVGNWWNDRISSIRIAPRTLVIIFQHRGFKGVSATFENPYDSYWLVNLLEGNWNDKVSSIKTYKIG
ncbi:hypothetical protein IGW_05330 [Bacillus cereus ISP3191]|uniref:beta/gamma crystallin domain-containing protein n=1 Tax=Bacillus cereus group TaxID=86661 RepID=UPI000279522D|nr:MULTISPECIES: beta/gamma crystallin domain-containing protein [Bacillus cereus group]EJQ86855.1 hypothetical protein IGW_05330 [Bacillus cereus ISP3191]MCU5684719.1 beta/gamma crystallin domain-containing protein [Bacillus wiedmannii]MDR4319750.1 hypothetical protein [Bacillus paranthracis]